MSKNNLSTSLKILVKILRSHDKEEIRQRLMNIVQNACIHSYNGIFSREFAISLICFLDNDRVAYEFISSLQDTSAAYNKNTSGILVSMDESDYEFVKSKIEEIEKIKQIEPVLSKIETRYVDITKTSNRTLKKIKEKTDEY